MKRRDFIKTGVVASAALVAGRAQASDAVEGRASSNRAALPRRAYGNTGVELSVIGFGGIVVKNAEQDHANRVVAESVERGVDYFDVAPAYGDAEIKLGPALEPYRKDVFLACKTKVREREGAEVEFARSLERLRTDYFDLYQLHVIRDVGQDVDAAFAKGGVMDMLIDKKKSGQIRFLGFSAHSIVAAIAAMERYDFDSVLFPVNYASYYKNDWGAEIMAMAQRKGVARLAIKAMVRQRWTEEERERSKYKEYWYEPLDDYEEASLGLRWTLSQPVTAAIPPGIESLFRMALDIAATSITITKEETEKLVLASESLDPLFPRG